MDVGWPEISPRGLIRDEIIFLLHERRVSPPKLYISIEWPQSRLKRAGNILWLLDQAGQPPS